MVEGFQHTDAGLIPIDWNAPKLSEISNFENGKAHEQFIDDKGDYVVVNSKFISTDGEVAKFSNKNLSPLQKGNIAIVMSDIPNGKALAKCFFVDRDNRYTLNQRIGCIIPNEEIDNDYLFYKLNRNKYFISFDSGSGQTNLKKSEILNCPVALPPTKAEQTAIATALSDADALITQLEKLIAKKRMIKQGAMQELLASTSSAQGKPKEGWEVKKLGEIANIRRGASPRPIQDPKWFSDSGRGWIRISDVTSSNVYLNTTTQYLSEDGVRNSVVVNKGDLIMSICATIGIPIIINIPACIHDGFVLFKNYEKCLDTFFLYFFLQAKTEVLTSKGQPGTQKNLNTTIVGDIEMDFPNLKEQKRIGEVLRDIDIELSGLEKKLEKYKMLKQGMMQNLLTGKIRLNH